MIARIFLEGLAAISNPQPAQYSSTSFPSPALRVIVGWTVLGPTKFQMLRLMRPFLSFSLLLPGNQSGQSYVCKFEQPGRGGRYGYRVVPGAITPGSFESRVWVYPNLWRGFFLLFHGILRVFLVLCSYAVRDEAPFRPFERP